MAISSFIKILELKSFVCGARVCCTDEFYDCVLENIENMIKELVALETPYELVDIVSPKDTE